MGPPGGSRAAARPPGGAPARGEGPGLRPGLRGRAAVRAGRAGGGGGPGPAVPDHAGDGPAPAGHGRPRDPPGAVRAGAGVLGLVRARQPGAGRRRRGGWLLLSRRARLGRGTATAAAPLATPPGRRAAAGQPGRARPGPPGPGSGPGRGPGAAEVGHRRLPARHPLHQDHPGNGWPLAQGRSALRPLAAGVAALVVVVGARGPAGRASAGAPRGPAAGADPAAGRGLLAPRGGGLPVVRVAAAGLRPRSRGLRPGPGRRVGGGRRVVAVAGRAGRPGEPGAGPGDAGPGRRGGHGAVPGGPTATRASPARRWWRDT